MKTLLILLCLSTYSTVLAEEAENHPCKADIEKFCKGIKAGGGNILRCLKEHKESLSPGCVAKGEAIKERRKKRRAEKDKLKVISN